MGVLGVGPGVGPGGFAVRRARVRGALREDGRVRALAEREAFLLGARIEGVRPAGNPVLARIAELRKEARWWQRRPVYLDTRGLDLSGLPPAARIEVRRFEDRSGRTLFAIYNGSRARGARFRLDGSPVEIPAEEFSVVEAPHRRRGR